MTLDQIEFVLREYGWDGKPGNGPVVSINRSFLSASIVWIERGLVVVRPYEGGSKSFRDPSEITQISRSAFYEMIHGDDYDPPPEPHLRVVKS